MRLPLIAALAFLCAAFGCRAADLNSATQAELETIKGVGPALSERILAARAERAFDGWSDLERRVQGLGRGRLQQWSAQGWTVAGAPYPSARAASAASGASR